jgi:16S rRNA (guanine966-N2)-methyltransferase
MRIAGGELKGRRIIVPSIKELRPSTEKTREAIFSTLGDDVVDARVADLFCGSGALGIEALSRGAAFSLFIDSSRAAILAVRKTIMELGLESRSEIRRMEALAIRGKHLENTSIIFADPPYGEGYGKQLIDLLCLKKISGNGILVLEHESGWKSDRIGPEVMKKLEFGDSSVTFFRIPAFD